MDNQTLKYDVKYTRYFKKKKKTIDEDCGDVENIGNG